MNILDAVRGEIAPYTADRITIEKSLIDFDLSAADDYTKEKRGKVAQVSIVILTSFLSLTSESESSFSQSYDKAGLQQKIAALAKSNGLEDSISDSTISNGSDRW